MGVYSDVTGIFHAKHAQYTDFLEKYLKFKLRAKAFEWIGKIPNLIKRQIEDPDMPNFVKSAIHRAIDTVWPDIQAELVWEFQVLVDGDEIKYQDKIEDASKPNCILAYIRYHLFPCDRGTWWCLRDPLYVIVNILALIPYYGIYSFMYLFIFLIIDKSDEYQLVYFILSFKGAQFFSWGIVKGIVGYSTYFFCVTFPPIDDLFSNLDVTQLTDMNLNITRRVAPSCETSGPGMSTPYWVAIVSWLLPLVLCWIAQLLLPWSKEKGRSKLKTFQDDGDEQEFTSGAEGKSAQNLDVQNKKFSKQGGYLKRMLIFDFVIFLLCVALMALIIALQPDLPGGESKWHAFYNASDSHWQVKQTLFFCQFIYGIFSIVFVPFIIPLLQAILTHSAPTAYNNEGQCCKFQGASKEKPKPVASNAMEEEEKAGIMSNFTNIANNRDVDFNSVFKTRKKAATATTSEATGAESV